MRRFDYIVAVLSAIAWTVGGCGQDLGDVPRFGSMLPGQNNNAIANANDNASTDDNDNDAPPPNDNNDNGSSDENDNAEPQTFLRVDNFGGLPREVFLDNNLVAEVPPGESSDDIAVDPGFHTICIFRIGMIDGDCEVRELIIGQVNVFLVSD